MKLIKILGALFFSGMVAATPIKNIVVFGDSLSDNGNLYEAMKHQLPSSPPYFAGRFSNGPVWVEQLAAQYFPKNPNGHFLDYAFGGAGVSEQDGQDDDTVDGVLNHLKKEIIKYLEGHGNKASEDTLYIVWIGANNYLGWPADADEAIRIVNKGIAVSLQRLAKHGAKNILVLNLPDLGRTPAAREFGSVTEFTYLTDAHNQLLQQTGVDLKNKYPEVNWVFYDMNVTFRDLTENPGKYGFTNVINPCHGYNQNADNNISMLSLAIHVAPDSPVDSCQGFLYFDLVHPTTFAHQVMAEKAKEVLDNLGFEFLEE